MPSQRPGRSRLLPPAGALAACLASALLAAGCEGAHAGAQEAGPAPSSARPEPPSRARRAGGSATIRYMQYRHVFAGGAPGGEARFAAFVEREEAPPARIELGPPAPIAKAARAWRAAVEAAADPGGPEAERAERRAGERLRGLLLDRLEDQLGEGTGTLLVAPDGPARGVPLDALCAADGARIGERFLVVLVDPAAAPEAPRPTRADPPALLALGDPFEGAPEGARFGPLPESRREVLAIAERFERARGRPPRVLLGADATRAALAADARGASHVHLATHGWLATAAELGTDAGSGRDPREIPRLALAGATQGPDAASEPAAILDGAELARLPLAGAELVVLSADESAAGVGRAGAPPASLLSALHAAGAHRAIACLWKVDPRARRELFERFYAHLWGDALPAAEALWRAKEDLRAAGRPVRDWGGWVLSGDAR